MFTKTFIIKSLQLFNRSKKLIILPKLLWILQTPRVKRSLSDLLRRDVCLWHHFVWNICTYMYRWFIQWLKGAFRVVEPYLTTRSQNASPSLFTYSHSLSSVHSTGRLVHQPYTTVVACCLLFSSSSPLYVAERDNRGWVSLTMCGQLGSST